MCTKKRKNLFKAGAGRKKIHEIKIYKNKTKKYIVVWFWREINT